VTDRDDSIGSAEAGERPAPDPSASAGGGTSVRSDSDGGGEHPELFVAGAFLGGLAAAIVLKRVARG
jgi:hypothetical protein